IRSLAGFHAANPGFQPLFYGSTTSKHLAAAAEQLKEQCIARVDGLMAARNPELEPARRRLLATMDVEIIKTLLPLAASADAATRERLLDETKTLLVAHMREALASCGVREESQDGRKGANGRARGERRVGL